MYFLLTSLMSVAVLQRKNADYSETDSLKLVGKKNKQTFSMLYGLEVKTFKNRFW